MASWPRAGRPPNLQVLSGGALSTVPNCATIPAGRGNRPLHGPDFSPVLRVFTLPWLPVGRVEEFAPYQPRVTLVRRPGSSRRVPTRPVYVLRKEGQEFLVLDMQTGGRYEYRLAGEHLYIRRLHLPL